MSEIKNATISSTSLGEEDHGIFTAYVHLSGDGWGVGFGGYALDDWSEADQRRVGSDFGCEFIKAVLETLEVKTWEKLVGTPCRVETEGFGGQSLRLGHYIKDKWLDPKALAEKFKELRTRS